MKTTLETAVQSYDHHFTKLTPHPEMADTFQANVNFSGYASLFSTVTDLMKLCAHAMLTNERHISYVIENTNVDLAGILELAIQLMPTDEAELLDRARELLQHKRIDREPAPQQPEYNYSTTRILEAVAS